MSVEIPRFHDPRETTRPFTTALKLTFGGAGLEIDTKFLLWTKSHLEPGASVRSMILFITADLSDRVFTHRMLEAGSIIPALEQGEIKVRPMRISDNPKRNRIYVGSDYEILFKAASGDPRFCGGTLEVDLKSRKPVRKIEFDAKNLDFPTFLKQRIEARRSASPIMLPY
jgi:hypothetical protein